MGDHIYREALESLIDQYTESVAGSGQLALVTGGLASGKTRLLYDFASYVKQQDALHLTATGSRAESTFPVGVIDQLCRNAEIPPEVATRISGLLQSDSLAREYAPDDLDLRRQDARIIHAISVELLELSRNRPLVISIDDMQFVDGLSLQLLLHLRRRMASAQVMIVMTEWSWGHPALSRFHAEITQQPHRHLKVAPLSVAEVTELLAQETDLRHAEEYAPAFHRFTAGNPLLTRALMEDYGQRCAALPACEGDPAERAAGPAFAQAVLNCLYRWDTRLLEVAQGLVVLGEEASPQLVGQLVSLPVESVEQVVQVLSAAGLLKGSRFRHSVAEDAVLGTLDSTTRARRHGAAARLLQNQGADAQTVAAHLIAAGGTPDNWNVPVLKSAAARAQADDDVDRVVDCLELAVAAATSNEERRELRRGLARSVWRLDPAAADRHHTEARQAMRDGTLTKQDCAALLKQSLWQGDLATAKAANQAYMTLDGPRDKYTEAELVLTYRWFYGPMSGHSCEDPESARRGDSEAREEDPWTRAVNSVAAGPLSAGVKNAVASAEHILESCRLGEPLLEVVIAALLTLVCGNLLDRAGERCDALYAEAERRGGLTWQAALGSVRADIALRRGDLSTAVSHAQSALALLPPQSWGVMLGYPLSTLVRAHTAMGEYDAAEESVRQFTSEATPTTVWGLRFLHARGHYYLATERVLAAVKDFQTCGRLAYDAELDVAELVPWRNGLAEANMRLGRTNVAQDLVKQQLNRPQGVDLCTRGVSLRLLAAAAGDPMQRTALLRKSVDLLQVSGDRMELARSLADLSEAYQGVGEFDEARATAWRAVQETKICQSGSRPLQRVPAQRSVETVVPAQETETDTPATAIGTGADGVTLSEAEGRVAQLAARGFSNREISRKLFITVSTVEQHLTRVYRKLGVNSRRALPTLLPLPQLQAM
ncbi:LuxR C-terminal-related transcriptional regulator [Streptomyces sp. NPDC008163]|uniref:helix-turn-helix transcriptional regulator n=1 Tax=Streptomyces sp. NPDC008163 TaxID=3364818 RepID=UPI0036E1A5F5